MPCRWSRSCGGRWGSRPASLAGPVGRRLLAPPRPFRSPRTSGAPNSKRGFSSGVGMAAERDLDPLAVLERDLRRLGDEAPTTPRWDPASDESMIAWCETELGIKLRGVPKVLAVFLEALHAFQRRERLRLAVL